MEIWALCEDCKRWFYCEHAFDETAEGPTCPVCGAEPRTIQDRAAPDEPVPDAASAGRHRGTGR